MDEDGANKVAKLTIPPIARRTAHISSAEGEARESLASVSTATTSELVRTSWASGGTVHVIDDSIDLEAHAVTAEITARTELPVGCCGPQHGFLGFIGESSVRSMTSLKSWASVRSAQSSMDRKAAASPSIRKKVAETLDHYLLSRFTTFRGTDISQFGAPCDVSFCDAEDRLHGICRKSFAQRIDLEIKMLHTLPKFSWFIMAFSIFLLIQWIEYHPENYSETHKSLRSHFKLDSDFYDIDRVHNLVSYLEDFATAAQNFNALHPYYWCPDSDTSPLSPLIPERIKCRKRDKVSFDEYYKGCSGDCGACSAGCGACGTAKCGVQSGAACSACSAGCSGNLSGCGAKACSATLTACSGDHSQNSSMCNASKAMCGVCSGNHSAANSSAKMCGAMCATGCGVECGSNNANVSHGNARLLMPQGIGRNTPFMHLIEFSVPRHAPLSPGSGSDSYVAKTGYALPQGIFGVAANGVLIVGSHRKGGHVLPLTWHFDDCGGHGDSDGWYHYHFPPSCLLSARGGAVPSLATWWMQEAPETYWPQRAAPSPLLGYALDGHPIYGPYGPDGRLVTAANLDRCHGKLVPGPNGTQVYRYYWLVVAPFLPPCFSDVPVNVDWNLPASKPCPNEDVSEAAQESHGLSVDVDDFQSTLLLKATGCPDHAYFRNSMLAQRVDPVLEEKTPSNRRLPCSASMSDQCGTCGASGPGAIDIFNPCAAGFGEDKPPPPDSYRRVHPFSMITASVMPPLLWQTRFDPVDCASTFVNRFNNQSMNPNYNAPLDAPRQDPIIRCRSKTLSTARHLGYSAVRLGDDESPRYSVFLSNSITHAIKEYDWIDDMTNEVTLALLLYTPGLEDLSLLRLKFKVQASGRINPSFVLTTHSTFTDRNDFAYWLALKISFLVVALCRVVSSLRDCWTETWLDEKRSIRRFDACLAIIFLAFSGFSLLRRLYTCSLLDEVNPLIESFYGVEDIKDAAQIDQTLSRYFQVLTLVMNRVNEEEVLKMVAYFLIIVSIIRLIGYMSVHPRIAVLSQTLASASDNIFHFSLVFTFICSLLSWLACWSFGPDKDVFCTLQYALLTQFKMVMGEFPFDDPWKETVLERMWYLCYAILIFFLAVNIFLAIIVEAFLLVKRRLADEVLVERSIVVDFVCLFRYWLLGPSMNWPSRLSVARHLNTTRHFQGAVNSKELRSSKFLNFKSRFEAQQYLDFYFSLLGEHVLSKEGKEFVRLKQQQKETHRCLVVLFNVDQVQMERSARMIQESWRRRAKVKQAAEAMARSKTIRTRTTRSRYSSPVSIASEYSGNVPKSSTLPSLLSRIVVKQKSFGSISSGDEIYADV